MRYCPVCENLLISKKGKLYCRACNIEIKAPKEPQEENIAVKLIKHDLKDFDPVLIIGKLDDNHITQEYRKAYEDFFTSEQEI